VAYTDDHLHVSWGGTLPGGEIWSNGVKFARGTHLIEDWSTHLAAIDLDAVASELQTFYSTAAMGISSTAKLSFMKLAHVNTAGIYAEAPRVHEYTPVISGPSSANNWPNQCSVAVTLWSGESFGRANYGRFYLPPTPQTLDGTTNRIAAFTAGAIADAAVSFLNSIGAAIDSVTFPMYLANMSKLGSGTTKHVTKVRVGEVVDTQRKRRNANAEVYETRTL
jgi:hypothetical protein